MPGEMNPSTFQQVRENMDKLGDVLIKLGDISDVNMDLKKMEELLEKLEQMFITPNEPDPGPGTGTTGGVGGDSDVGTDPNGNARVFGVHVDTTDPDTNTPPNGYTRGFTISIKKASVVDLAGKAGIGGEYVFVFTIVKDGTEAPEININAYQMVIMDSANGLYRRNSDSPSAWGNWMGPEQQKIRLQFVQADVKPSDQIEGEYWCEPLGDYTEED